MATPVGVWAIMVLVSMAISPSLAVPLTYDALDTIVDLMFEKDFIGLQSANLLVKGEPRAIYRKDLDPNYIAYYEIRSRDGKEYFLLSGSHKTGDNRFVESGPINVTANQRRPTDALNEQARLVGESCYKHYRLSNAPLYICENSKGVPVAANYNWTSNAPVNLKEWRSLSAMLKKDLDRFNSDWRKLNEEVAEELEWGNLHKVGKEKQTQFAEDALEPGSTHVVALGLGKVQPAVRLSVKQSADSQTNITSQEWLKRLCNVLNIGKGCGGPTVYPSIAIAENGISYFKIVVEQDKLVLEKNLLKTDISFTIQLKTPTGELIEKSFGIETNFTSRTKRWSSWSYGSIPQWNLFPNYNQHACCGCYSGCGPVAWAQIFGYYDRLAHTSPPWGYGYNYNLYRCFLGSWGSPACVAPSFTPTSYVVDIRRQVNTFCLFGGGATAYWDMTDAKLWRWFRARQSTSASLASHVSWWSTIPGINRGWIRDRAISHIQQQRPAIVGIWVGWSQHYAVATKYRKRYKRWRICWWFFGWHCTQWFYIWQYEWYLHMGWGLSSNGWRKAKAFSAFAALK